MAKILSIDLGTTYFKMSLFDGGGRARGVYRMTPPVAAPRTGYMELPANALIDALVQGVAELRNGGGDLSDVQAVTFATQTNSFLLLDDQDRPLTPLILWPDRRAEYLDDEVRRRCGIPGFSAITGIPQLNFQCMAAKLLWLQEHSPEIWKRSRRVCLVSDYLTFLLTGQHVTEAGAAGLTGLVDIHRCEWNPQMLARFGMDVSRWPTIVRAGTDLGPIRHEVARRLGLPASCRFVVGCLDQYAGAIGVGNVQPGMISETTGTVLATVCCADKFAARPGAGVIQGPAFREGLYWRMCFGEISANYLEWYRNQLPDHPGFDQLIALAEAVQPGAGGLKLRADIGLSDVESVFDGLTDLHSRGHIVRCILEAVAWAMNAQVAALCDGIVPPEIRCAGGAARSEPWLQIKADVLGVATAATVCLEPTSLGAAVLARAALDGTDVQTIARRWVCMKPPHLPDLENHRRYCALRSERCGLNEGVFSH